MKRTLTKQSWKCILMRPAAMPGFLETALSTASSTMVSASGQDELQKPTLRLVEAKVDREKKKKMHRSLEKSAWNNLWDEEELAIVKKSQIRRMFLGNDVIDLFGNFDEEIRCVYDAYLQHEDMLC